eukprot:TRINITY_DN16399_c0_g1_i2.p1 TRINITY_DN16399_c0_g1~~TRINITY_DN16399_c0_g1_i2.p1  ORF type:complete len:474 (+),score=153.03 TRINITY_DN16399_c0_g1_i2:73-1422(+)
MAEVAAGGEPAPAEQQHPEEPPPAAPAEPERGREPTAPDDDEEEQERWAIEGEEAQECGELCAALLGHVSLCAVRAEFAARRSVEEDERQERRALRSQCGAVAQLLNVGWRERGHRALLRRGELAAVLCCREERLELMRRREEPERRAEIALQYGEGRRALLDLHLPALTADLAVGEWLARCGWRGAGGVEGAEQEERRALAAAARWLRAAYDLTQLPVGEYEARCETAEEEIGSRCELQAARSSAELPLLAAHALDPAAPERTALRGLEQQGRREAAARMSREALLRLCCSGATAADSERGARRLLEKLRRDRLRHLVALRRLDLCEVSEKRARQGMEDTLSLQRCEQLQRGLLAGREAEARDEAIQRHAEAATIAAYVVAEGAALRRARADARAAAVQQRAAALHRQMRERERAARCSSEGSLPYPVSPPTSASIARMAPPRPHSAT